MPIGSGSVRSIKDRSIFGFRKADRSSASPSPDGGQLAKVDEDQAPPALPPLGALNSSNSFANLLVQLEQPPPLPTIVKTSPTSASNSLLTVPKVSAASSSETLRQNHVSLPQATGTMEFVSTGTYFSTLANNPSNTIPERHQSGTSTTSYSEQSDTSSAQSTSSRSSVEDLSEKEATHKPPDSIPVSHIDVDFLTNSFQDVSLDLKLSSNRPARPVRPSSPSLNKNKPLPPAPKQSPYMIQSALDKASLPELDSAPIRKRTEVSRKSSNKRTRASNSSGYSKPRTQVDPVAEASTHNRDAQIVPPRRNSARLRPRPSKSKKPYKGKARLDSAEQAILHILLNLESLSDLQATAMVNKAFYRVFKRRETQIVESVLYNTSLPAWELRQLVKREQKRNPFHIKAVQRDLNALRALEAFMVMRCNKICRTSTVEGLVGNDKLRRQAIENALWRIWTFCKLFGKGTPNDAGVNSQIMWLEGKSLPDKRDKSNIRNIKAVSAVTMPELEDISEMWRCMELLLSGFRGRESEASEAGVYDQCKFDEKNKKNRTEYLEEWIYDILSVGPKAVLTMISCSFEHAKVLGVNKWTPPRQGRSRRTFLKGALEQVYRDLLVEEARLKAESFARSMQREAMQVKPLLNSTSKPKRTLSLSSKYRTSHYSSSSEQTMDLELVTHDEELRPEEGRQMRLEIRPDCDPETILSDLEQPTPVVSPTTNPASYSSIVMMSNASARIGATLFPIQRSSTSTIQPPRRPPQEDYSEDIVEPELRPKVVDPTDRAISLLVKQLGFPEKLAKQALAMSDDGSGINVNRAVELLSDDKRLISGQSNERDTEATTTSTGVKPAVQQIKDYCEGTCRRVSLIHRKRSNLRGLMNRASFRQSTALSVILDSEDEDGAIQHLAKAAIAPSIPISMPSIPEKSTAPNGGYHNLTEFMKYRNSIRAQSPLSHQSSFRKGHRKSSSTGTIDIPEDVTEHTLSPTSPATPNSCMGGFVTIRPLSQQISEHADDENTQNMILRPKVTLTRVGTGKRPTSRINLTRRGTVTAGKPPEIIGYSY